MLTSYEHRREAERLLGMSWEDREDENIRQLVARAQVHATLAAENNDGARVAALMQATAAWICAELTSTDEVVRRHAADLCDELDRERFDMSAVVERLSAKRGHGPYHFPLDGIVYDLRWQYEDRAGVVWEHTGGWARVIGAPLTVPVMGTPDVRPALANRPFDVLAAELGPLFSRKDRQSAALAVA